MKVALSFSKEEVEAMKWRLFREANEGAFREAAVELAQFRARWRTAGELHEEFGVPPRTLRQLHEARKVGKSAGISPRHPFYFRPDLVALIEGGHVKSALGVAAEARSQREVPRLRVA